MSPRRRALSQRQRQGPELSSHPSRPFQSSCRSQPFLLSLPFPYSLPGDRASSLYKICCQRWFPVSCPYRTFCGDVCYARPSRLSSLLALSLPDLGFFDLSLSDLSFPGHSFPEPSSPALSFPDQSLPDPSPFVLSSPGFHPPGVSLPDLSLQARFPSGLPLAV